MLRHRSSNLRHTIAATASKAEGFVVKLPPLTMSSFESFKQNFKGDIVDPSSPDYKEAINRWALNAVKRERYVFFPKNSEDVSEALKYVVGNGIPLAVKGGGHNPSGASSVEDGICIDLSRFISYANVNPETQTADVGGGTLWTTVDKATIAHGLAVPGGTVSLTGVAGLTLGGGHGFLSGKHGLTTDSVLEMTVVLADGSIVKASKDSHPDLFWALRGGGGNFGIVTNFKFQLHPQRDNVYAGFLIYPAAQLEELVRTFDEWIPGITEEDSIGLGMTRLPDSTPACMIVVVHNGPVEEGRRRFKPFFDLGPMLDLTREMPYPQVNDLVNENASRSRRYYMTGTSLRSKVSAHGKQVFDRIMALSEKHPKDETLPPYEVHIMYEVFSSRKKIMSVSPDETAFRSRGPQHHVLVSVVWDQEAPGDTEIARSISREITSIVESTAVADLKESDNKGYGNYLTDPTEIKTRSLQLWGNNYPRLQKIKKRYDPTNVFNRWVPITPSD